MWDPNQWPTKSSSQLWDQSYYQQHPPPSHWYGEASDNQNYAYPETSSHLPGSSAAPVPVLFSVPPPPILKATAEVTPLPVDTQENSTLQSVTSHGINHEAEKFISQCKNFYESDDGRLKQSPLRMSKSKTQSRSPGKSHTKSKRRRHSYSRSRSRSISSGSLPSISHSPPACDIPNPYSSSEAKLCASSTLRPSVTEEEALECLWQLHEREYRNYKIEPETHPKYRSNKMMWEHQLKSKGFNIKDRAVQLGWDSFWDSMLKEMFTETWKEKKLNFCANFGISQPSEYDLQKERRHPDHAKTLPLETPSLMSSESLFSPISEHNREWSQSSDRRSRRGQMLPLSSVTEKKSPSRAGRKSFKEDRLSRKSSKVDRRFSSTGDRSRKSPSNRESPIELSSNTESSCKSSGTESSSESSADRESSRKSADKRSSRKSSRKLSADRKSSRKTSADRKSSRKSSADRKSSRKSSADKKSSRKSSADKKSSRKSSADKKSSRKSSADKKSSGKSSADKKSPGKSSADKKSPGKSSADRKSPGKSSADRKSSGKSSAGRKSSGKSSADRKSSGKSSADRKSSGKSSSTRDRLRESTETDINFSSTGDRSRSLPGIDRKSRRSPKSDRKPSLGDRSRSSPKSERKSTSTEDKPRKSPVTGKRFSSTEDRSKKSSIIDIKIPSLQTDIKPTLPVYLESFKVDWNSVLERETKSPLIMDKISPLITNRRPLAKDIKTLESTVSEKKRICSVYDERSSLQNDQSWLKEEKSFPPALDMKSSTGNERGLTTISDLKLTTRETKYSQFLLDNKPSKGTSVLSSETFPIKKETSSLSFPVTQMESDTKVLPCKIEVETQIEEDLQHSPHMDLVFVLKQMGDKFGSFSSPLCVLYDLLQKVHNEGKCLLDYIDNDAETLLIIIKDKIKGFLVNKEISIIQKAIYQETVTNLNSLLHQIDERKPKPEVKKEKYGIDSINIENIAKATAGKDCKDTVNFIREALDYHEIEVESKELMNIYLSVKKIQASMIPKEENTKDNTVSHKTSSSNNLPVSVGNERKLTTSLDTAMHIPLELNSLRNERQRDSRNPTNIPPMEKYSRKSSKEQSRKIIPLELTQLEKPSSSKNPQTPTFSTSKSIKEKKEDSRSNPFNLKLNSSIHVNTFMNVFRTGTDLSEEEKQTFNTAMSDTSENAPISHGKQKPPILHRMSNTDFGGYDIKALFSDKNIQRKLRDMPLKEKITLYSHFHNLDSNKKKYLLNHLNECKRANPDLGSSLEWVMNKHHLKQPGNSFHLHRGESAPWVTSARTLAG